MREIQLFTRTLDYVTTVNVPPMIPPMEIIQWGGRYFVLSQDGVYKEGLLWYVIDEPPHEQERNTQEEAVD